MIHTHTKHNSFQYKKPRSELYPLKPRLGVPPPAKKRRAISGPTMAGEEERGRSGGDGDEDQMVAPIPRVITFLSTLLQRVSESNDRSLELQAPKVSAFHGLTRPTISIQSYLQRIFKYANCSPCCFVVAYVYLDRFVQRHPSLPIDSFNVHRLLITSVLVSAKFMDDLYYNNAYYAKVGGISTMEMNLLEVDFLFGLGFKLNVTPNTFHTYCSYLQTEVLLTQPNLQITIPVTTVKHRSFAEDESSHQKQLAV